LPAARARGFTRIRATVRADNPGAISFYESVGFGADDGAFLDAGCPQAVRLLRVLDERC
jgi:hypothetical protein